MLWATFPRAAATQQMSMLAYSALFGWVRPLCESSFRAVHLWHSKSNSGVCVCVPSKEAALVCDSKLEGSGACKEAKQVAVE